MLTSYTRVGNSQGVIFPRNIADFARKYGFELNTANGFKQPVEVFPAEGGILIKAVRTAPTIEWLLDGIENDDDRPDADWLGEARGREEW